MTTTLKEAMKTAEKGLKVIIADGECQLARQRRVRAEDAEKLKRGMRVTRARYGVDDEICTGDHSCIRLSGCPSLTVKPSPDPLRTDPVATVVEVCVGCGLCGEVAHAAVLVPLVLPRRDHAQRHLARPRHASPAPARDRVAAPPAPNVPRTGTDKRSRRSRAPSPTLPPGGREPAMQLAAKEQHQSDQTADRRARRRRRRRAHAMDRVGGGGSRLPGADRPRSPASPSAPAPPLITSRSCRCRRRSSTASARCWRSRPASATSTWR